MDKLKDYLIMIVLIIQFACIAGLCNQQQTLIDANNKVLKLLSTTALYIPEGAIR